MTRCVLLSTACQTSPATCSTCSLRSSPQCRALRPSPPPSTLPGEVRCISLHAVLLQYVKCSGLPPLKQAAQMLLMIGVSPSPGLDPRSMPQTVPLSAMNVDFDAVFGTKVANNDVKTTSGKVRPADPV